MWEQLPVPGSAQATKHRPGSIKARNAQGAAGTGTRPLSQRAAYRSDAKRHRSIFAYSLPVLREASPLLFIIHHSLREAPPIGRISGSLMAGRNKAAPGKIIAESEFQQAQRGLRHFQDALCFRSRLRFGHREEHAVIRIIRRITMRRFFIIGGFEIIT